MGVAPVDRSRVSRGTHRSIVPHGAGFGSSEHYVRYPSRGCNIDGNSHDSEAFVSMSSMVMVGSIWMAGFWRLSQPA